MAETVLSSLKRMFGEHVFAKKFPNVFIRKIDREREAIQYGLVMRNAVLPVFLKIAISSASVSYSISSNCNI
ncbi:MAG: hypothetical protein WAM14_06295 [Candidatus Nitrosopolaris sp.]